MIETKKILFILTVCVLCTVCYAKAPPHRGVPAYPGVIERVQPDGDTLHTYLRGDEHKHWKMTLDGWQIMEDKHGRLCYATTNCAGKAVPSRKQAHNKEQRTARETAWLEKHGIKKQVVLY